MEDKKFQGKSLNEAITSTIYQMKSCFVTKLYYFFGPKFFEWQLRKKDREMKKQLKELKTFMMSIFKEEI